MKSKLFVLIAIICLTETAAIACVKKYHNGDGLCFFLFAVTLYAMVCYLLNLSFAENGMGMTNVIWSGMSVMLVTLAGVFLFHEKIHMHDIVAAAMITGGLLIFKYTE